MLFVGCNKELRKIVLERKGREVNENLWVCIILMRIICIKCRFVI